MDDSPQLPALPIFSPGDAQAMADVAEDATIAALAHVTTALEQIPEGILAEGLRQDLLRVMGRLLVVDMRAQHLELVLATSTQLLVDLMPALPAGALQDRVGHTLVYHDKLPTMELREVIATLSRTQQAQRLRDAEARLGRGVTH